MMHMGNMTKDFVPVGKEEQAEIKNEDNSIKVATLLGKKSPPPFLLPIHSFLKEEKNMSLFFF